MNPRSTNPIGQLALAILLVVGVFAGGVAIALAGDDAPVEIATATEAEVTGVEADPETTTVPATEETEPAADQDLPVDHEASEMSFDEDCFYELTPEDLEAMKAETDELALQLDRFSIEYERVEEEDGYVHIEYDYDNPVIEAVVSSHYNDGLVGHDLDGDFPFDMEEIRELSNAMIVAFDEANFDYTLDEDDVIEWDYDNEAANDLAELTLRQIAEETGSEFAAMAADSFDEDFAGDEDFEAMEDDFIDCGDEPYEPSAEELAEMQKVNDALIAAFDAAGIEYEVMTDGPFTFVEFDWNDEAASTVADGVYQEIYPGEYHDCDSIFIDEFEGEAIAELEDYEPTDEDLAEMQEVNNALIAAFDAAGVEYEVMTDGPFTFVEFDWNDESAMELADSVYQELFPDDFADINMDIADFADGCEGFDGGFIDGEFGEYDEDAERAWAAARIAALRSLETDLEAAGVDVLLEVHDEEGFEWSWMTFDLTNEASVPIVTAAVAAYTG